MWTMNSSQISSMFLTTEVEVKSIYRHETKRELPDKVIDGTRDGSCKVCFHVPHFVDLVSAATKHLLFCPYILPISTPKKNVVL